MVQEALHPLARGQDGQERPSTAGDRPGTTNEGRVVETHIHIYLLLVRGMVQTMSPRESTPFKKSNATRL